MPQKILVVDDEPDAVELIQFNLKGAGFDVVTAGDGAEALKKARTFSPDLLVLDVMLPEVDGLEVCKLLRRDGATAGIPIIMLTAKAAEIDRVLGLELGLTITSPSRSARVNSCCASRAFCAADKLHHRQPITFRLASWSSMSRAIW